MQLVRFEMDANGWNDGLAHPSNTDVHAANHFQDPHCGRLSLAWQLC